MPTINRKTNHVKTVKWNINESSNYYNSKAWHQLRNAYYLSHPLCERCLLNGRSVQAEHVHHIHPFMLGKTDEERWRLLLDANNLMSLCIECHHEMHHQKIK